MPILPQIHGDLSKSYRYSALAGAWCGKLFKSPLLVQIILLLTFQHLENKKM